MTEYGVKAGARERQRLAVPSATTGKNGLPANRPTAALSIAEEMSTPIIVPVAPMTDAAPRDASPEPVATSSTREPARTLAAYRSAGPPGGTCR